MRWNHKSSVIPWLLYPAGDFIAQCITGDLNGYRLLALALAGGLIYQYEVPAWFKWLDQQSFSEEQLARYPFLRWLINPQDPQRRLGWLGRVLGAMVYFSPLWIARHMLILMVATTPWSQIDWLPAFWNLLVLGTKSFVINAPISFAGNYIIQVKLPLQYRFLGSIILTGLFSIAYALAYKFF